MAKPFLFMAEPARSGAATCKVCKEKIAKGDLRVGVISSFFCKDTFISDHSDVTGPLAATTRKDIDHLYDDHAGWQWRWHHVQCFKFEKFPALKDTSCFVDDGTNHGFTPFSSLSAAHKKTLENCIKGAGGGAAKPKATPKPKAATPAKRAAPDAGPPAKKAKTSSAALAGKTIVFTGTLAMKRVDATSAATSAGAKVHASVVPVARLHLRNVYSRDVV